MQHRIKRDGGEGISGRAIHETYHMSISFEIDVCYCVQRSNYSSKFDDLPIDRMTS